jgi:serine/threonine protein kinase
LFVQRNGSLKILDFGLARLHASTLTAMGQIVGTPDFMSPEQAGGEKVDARSDVFSAAAVSYLILTGRPPFTGPDLRRTLDALLGEDPAPMTDAEAPASVREVLNKGLAKDPARRYQSSAEMLLALEAVRP